MNVTPIDIYGFQLAHDGNSFELRPGLTTGADNGGNAGIAARQVLRGNSGGGTGSQLPHVVRFDQGQQIALRNFVQRNQESHLAAHVGVLLHREIASGVISCGHVVKESAGRKLEAPPRMNDHLTAGLFAGYVFDGLDGHGHGEKCTYFGFADMQRHSSLSTGQVGFYRCIRNLKTRDAATSSTSNSPARVTTSLRGLTDPPGIHADKSSLRR